MNIELALSWRDALRSRRFLMLGAGTAVFLIGALLSLNSYLQFNEQRSGVALADPVLARLPAVELSWAIFALIYGSLIATVVSLARQPRPLVIALQAYALLAVVRIAMMYTIPLEAPAGMIMLVDPLVRVFGGGENWAKDLFFSGHTSTTFLCALSVRSRPLKLACFVACATVAVFVLLQHVHYTIDVLVAPFVAFGTLHLARAVSGWVLDRQR